MSATRKTKHIIVSLLVMSILVIPIASLERRIPRASYEIIYGEEIDESESIEITRSPFTPVSSVILLNDSLLSEQSDWYRNQETRINKSRIFRQITVPFLNVTEIIFSLSAYVVSGPLEISMRYYDWPYDASTVGLPGEYCEIVQHATPDDFDNEGVIWVSVSVDGLDWSVIDELYFSIQVEFSVSQCPITIDLQRTNRESMYLLPEFGTTRFRPIVKFGEHEYYLSQVNDTIYLPSGTYSLALDWESYEHSFSDISITNETLTINIRIQSVRLDIEAYQKIPGLAIYLGGAVYTEYAFLIRDSPSFYLPSGNSKTIDVIGDPNNAYTTFHFSIGLDAGDNRNITLLISENWISIGGVAFTPGRLTILIASILVVVLTLVISRKKSGSSSIFLPFILLFLGSIIPSYLRTSQETYPRTLPLYSQYTETQTISLGIDISASSVSGSVTAISESGHYGAQFVNQLLFFVLLIAFVGVLFEYLRDDVDSETTDFLIATPILCYLFVQWFYIINLIFQSPGWSTISIGIAPFLTTFAFLLWLILYKRKGKSVLQSTSYG